MKESSIPNLGGLMEVERFNLNTARCVVRVSILFDQIIQLRVEVVTIYTKWQNIASS